MSRANNTAIKGVKSVDYGASLEMRHFDALPKTLRRMLSECKFNITAVEIRNYYSEHGYHKTRRDLKDLIVQYEKMAGGSDAA